MVIQVSTSSNISHCTLCLQHNRNSHPEEQPFFFVSATTKTQIADALLNVVNDDDEYKKRFAKYGVLGFERTNTAMYDCVRDVLHLTRNQTLYPTYY